MSSRKNKEEASKIPAELIPIVTLNCRMIGNRIREERKRLGITGTNLAEIVNISSTHLSNIEHGVRVPGVDIVADIALALGVSIDYLVRGIRPVIGASEWGMIRLRSDDEIAKELYEQEFYEKEEEGDSSHNDR